jgi:3-deoxy-manno-octulosonate cytidylyltransferase (CMP-KDO synthetase)
MTSSDCLTGTDRVAEVASRRDADWYVNVQGDEPFVDPAASKGHPAAGTAKEDVAAVNTMSVITEESEFRSETVPKPVTDLRGRLLYMSRAAIPTDKRLGFQQAFRQVGPLRLQACSALRAVLPTRREARHALEEIEDIEILRMVESGLRVQMIEVPASGIAIDTPRRSCPCTSSLLHTHKPLIMSRPCLEVALPAFPRSRFCSSVRR